MNTHFLQVIGFGPGSLGLIVAADRRGTLEGLLDRGVVFIDKRRDLYGLQYDISSNTAAADFLRGIAERGALGEVLRSHDAHYLRELGRKSASLLIANRVLKDLHSKALNIIEASHRSSVKQAVTISLIEQNSDGLFTSYDVAGRPVARSENVVIATGAQESAGPLVDWLSTVKGRSYLSSNLLSADDPSFILPALRNGAPVAIIGGSHSAFSVAELLIRKYGGAIGEGQIRILRRRQTRLRSDARAMYIRIKKGLETRISVLDGALECVPDFDGHAAVYITACGYAPVDIPVVPTGGKPIIFAAEHGQYLIDSEHLLLDSERRPVAGLYGLGLGRSKRIEGFSPFPGTRFQVSVRYFHNEGAVSILDSLHARASERSKQAINT